MLAATRATRAATAPSLVADGIDLARRVRTSRNRERPALTSQYHKELLPPLCAILGDAVDRSGDAPLPGGLLPWHTGALYKQFAVFGVGTVGSPEGANHSPLELLRTVTTQLSPTLPADTIGDVLLHGATIDADASATLHGQGGSPETAGCIVTAACDGPLVHALIGRLGTEQKRLGVGPGCGVLHGLGFYHPHLFDHGDAGVALAHRVAHTVYRKRDDGQGLTLTQMVRAAEGMHHTGALHEALLGHLLHRAEWWAQRHKGRALDVFALQRLRIALQEMGVGSARLEKLFLLRAGESKGVVAFGDE